MLRYPALSCACRVIAHHCLRLFLSTEDMLYASVTPHRTFHLFLHSKVIAAKCCVFFVFCFVLPFYFHCGKLDTTHKNCSKHLLIQLDVRYNRGCWHQIILLWWRIYAVTNFLIIKFFSPINICRRGREQTSCLQTCRPIGKRIFYSAEFSMTEVIANVLLLLFFFFFFPFAANEINVSWYLGTAF